MEPPLPPSRLRVDIEEPIRFSRDLAIEAVREPPSPEVVVLQEALEAYYKSRAVASVPEDVFVATDKCCVQRLRRMLFDGIRCDLEQMRRYRFPRTDQGREEYMLLLARFDPLPWNSYVWEVLSTLGPREMVQEWRFIWLQSFSRREFPAGNPEEVLKGAPNLTGYACLQDLFGINLEKALDNLIQCCPFPSQPLLLLLKALSPLLVPPSPLDVRDNPLLKKYEELCNVYQHRISPMLDWDKKLIALLKAEDWVGIFTFDIEISTKHPELFPEFICHLESALSQLLLDPQCDLPKLQSIFGQIRDKIVNMLVLRKAEVACAKIIKLSDNLTALHPFIQAFVPPLDKDWLLAFAPGFWSENFKLLTTELRSECAKLLTRRLPICTNPLSYFAWNRAVRLLQGIEQDLEQGIKEIEEALLHTRSLRMPSLMDPTWRQALTDLLPPKDANPDAYSLMQGKVSLHPMLMQTLKSGEGCAIKKDLHHSHPVAHLKNPGVPNVFYKWEPRAFGIQWIDHCLFHLVVGGHTPSLDFVKVKGRRGFFQLSEPIPGTSLNELLHDPSQPPPKIEPQSYSENIVRLFLDCESDGKSNNYQATPVAGTPFYRLSMIDGELALNRPYVFHPNSGEPRLEVLLASILLCFDQIHDPLHPMVANKLKNLKIYPVLKQVLIACKQARRRLLACVEETEETQAWERSDPRYLSISIQQRHLEHWYNTLWRIQRLLESPQIPTHMELLEILFPPIAVLVKQALTVTKSPEERFYNLFGHKYKVLSTLHNGQPRKTLLTQHSRKVLESCLAGSTQPAFNPVSHSMSIDSALELLEAIHTESQQIAHIRSELDKGNLVPFCSIKLQLIREEVLWGSKPTDRIQWNRLPPLLAQRILTAMQGFSYRQLHLANCYKAIEALPALLRTSPQLEVLDLTGLQFDRDIEFTPHCPEIRELNLSRTNITVLYGTFPQLTTLNVNDSTVRSVDLLTAPKLTLFSIERCYALEKLRIRPHSACRIAGTGCRLEAAVKMKIINSGNNLSYFYKGYEVEADLSLTSKGSDGETIFNACVSLNLVAQVEFIIKGLFSWVPGIQNRSPLHVALIEKKDAMVSLLAPCEQFIHALDEQHCTPLMIAAADDNQVYVELLLSVFQIVNDPQSPLFQFQVGYNTGKLIVLLHGALVAAARKNHTFIISQICTWANNNIGALWTKFKFSKSLYYSPLSVALSHNKVEATFLLLQEGATLDTDHFSELLDNKHLSLEMICRFLGLKAQEVTNYLVTLGPIANDNISRRIDLWLIQQYASSPSTYTYLRSGTLERLQAKQYLLSYSIAHIDSLRHAP